MSLTELKAEFSHLSSDEQWEFARWLQRSQLDDAQWAEWLAHSAGATEEQLRALRAELEKGIEKGIADLAAGRSYPWTESLFSEIREEARQQLRESRKKK
jgi:TPP-dependent pyruvate/acetoin dehydrogenase alpha subunit